MGFHKRIASYIYHHSHETVSSPSKIPSCCLSWSTPISGKHRSVFHPYGFAFSMMLGKWIHAICSFGESGSFHLAKYTRLTVGVIIHCYPYLLCCSDSAVLAVESPFKLAPVIFGYVIMFPALLYLLAPQTSPGLSVLSLSQSWNPSLFL